MRLKILLSLFFVFALIGLVASRDPYFLAYRDYLKLNSLSYQQEIESHQGQYSNVQRKVIWNNQTLKVTPPQIAYEKDQNKNVLAADPSTNIDVNLTTQTLCLNQSNGQNCFLISSGLYFPTPTGTFNIWTKLPSTLMRGPGYYLPGVPWTMYFYKSFGIHGTYWHNNFGHPMSHGCVNMRTPDAQFVYERVEVGTQVTVHY